MHRLVEQRFPRPMKSVWVLGDQLHRGIGALVDARPATHRIVIVESSGKLKSRPWHVQRAHFIVASMRRFAASLREDGFEVDYRFAPTMREGLLDHCLDHRPDGLTVTEPNSRVARRLADALDIEQVRSNQFLCHPDEFVGFATGRKTMKMEDFYRWQRRRLGYLMNGDEPVGGQWNFDAENREPPPRDGSTPWPAPPVEEADPIDHEVLASLPSSCTGTRPSGTWATSRAGALRRLEHFVRRVLPMFGPHEDAMLLGNWHLAHSMLSPYLNNGLLLPREVLEAAHGAYREGLVPLNSAEGFIRQVLGWREWVWNLYWAYGPDYASSNALGASRPLPPAFSGTSDTRMQCVNVALNDVNKRAWAHHIQRLMVLGNFALTSGINPQQFTRWMWDSFVDAAEWVMVPNVIGMSLHADGGRMATKPYASGGAYIDRMSDYCSSCSYDRTKRTGDDACPFTTLYWDFLLRHSEQFVRNPRVAAQVRSAQRLSDADAVRARAADVGRLLDAGRL